MKLTLNRFVCTIRLWNDAIRESPAVYKCAESRGVSFGYQKHHRPMEFLHTVQPCIKYLKGMWKELRRECQSNISCDEELVPIAESILLLHSFHHKSTDASCSVYENYKPLDVFFVLNAFVSSDEYLKQWSLCHVSNDPFPSSYVDKTESRESAMVYDELDQELGESDETQTESDEKALRWLFKYDQRVKRAKKRHLKKKKRKEKDKRLLSK